MQTAESPFNSQPIWGLVAAILTFSLLALIVTRTWPASDFPGPTPVSPQVLTESVTSLGVAFVSPDQLVIPFEVASVLLLAALIGAIVIARPEKES